MEEAIGRRLRELSEDASAILTKNFPEHAIKSGLVKTLARLASEYRGNSVWALVVMSVYSPAVLSRLRVDYIATI